MKDISNIDDLRTAVEKVVQYNWEDELNDYIDNCSNELGGNQRRGHIFETLVGLDNWLRGVRYTPESYVEEFSRCN